MRDISQFRIRFRFHVRVVDGVGGGTPLPALSLALLGREVALTRPLGCVDMVATAKAFDLLARTLGRCLDVPASLMGADKVSAALRTNPLASRGMVLEAIKICLCGLDLDQGGENGGCCRREVGAIRGGHIPAQLGQVIRQAAPRVSGKDRLPRSISIYLKGEDGTESEERVPGDAVRSRKSK